MKKISDHVLQNPAVGQAKLSVPDQERRGSSQANSAKTALIVWNSTIA